MELISIWIVLGSVLVVVFLVYWAYKQEEADYNNGICPSCHEPLRNFDCDSQGGRGYCCEHCGYVTWVSYSVDRKNKNGGA